FPPSSSQFMYRGTSFLLQQPVPNSDDYLTATALAALLTPPLYILIVFILLQLRSQVPTLLFYNINKVIGLIIKSRFFFKFNIFALYVGQLDFIRIFFMLQLIVKFLERL